jgi:hypothetical protein
MPIIFLLSFFYIFNLLFREKGIVPLLFLRNKSFCLGDNLFSPASEGKIIPKKKPLADKRSLRDLRCFAVQSPPAVYNNCGHKLRFSAPEKSAICDRDGYN